MPTDQVGDLCCRERGTADADEENKTDVEADDLIGDLWSEDGDSFKPGDAEEEEENGEDVEEEDDEEGEANSKEEEIEKKETTQAGEAVAPRILPRCCLATAPRLLSQSLPVHAVPCSVTKHG